MNDDSTDKGVNSFDENLSTEKESKSSLSSSQNRVVLFIILGLAGFLVLAAGYVYYQVNISDTKPATEVLVGENLMGEKSFEKVDVDVEEGNEDALKVDEQNHEKEIQDDITTTETNDLDSMIEETAEEFDSKTVWFNIEELGVSIKVGNKMAEDLIYYVPETKDKIYLSSKIMAEDPNCLPEKNAGLAIIGQKGFPNQQSIGFANGVSWYYFHSQAPCMSTEEKMEELLSKFNEYIAGDMAFGQIQIMENKVIDMLAEEEK